MTRSTASAACGCLVLLALCPPARAGAEQPGGLEPSVVERGYTDPFTVEVLGEVRFNATIDDDNDRLYNLAIAPGIGVFVVKGLQIGLQPQLRLDKAEDEDGDSYSVVYGGAGLFVNYVIDVRSVVFPFVGVVFAALGGESSVDIPTIGTSETRFNVVEIGPQLGVKIVIGNGILTLGFSYAFQTWGYEDLDRRSDRHLFWVGTGLGFWI